MNTRYRILGSVGLFTVAWATGCGARTPENPTRAAAGEAGPPIVVQAVSVSASRESGAMEIPATIESSRKAVVSSRLSATIVELNHREGDQVAARSILVRLDGEAPAASLSRAQAEDAAATRDLARAETLLAKGAATRLEVENATTAVARTRSALVAAREIVAYATIRAPFGGRITRKIANAGDSVNPGTPLLELEGEGGLEAVASVEGAVQQKLRVGQKVTVAVDGVTDPVTAVIRTLGPSADPSTHRFTLRADIPKGNAAVRAGLFARVLLPLAGAEHLILVPSGAILRRGGLTGVYVIKDGHAWLRWIAPGEPIGDSLEVRAGLNDKERVALEPQRLHDGALVSEGRQ